MLLLLTSREFVEAVHMDQERYVKRLLRQRQAEDAAPATSRRARPLLARLRGARGRTSLRTTPPEAAG